MLAACLAAALRGLVLQKTMCQLPAAGLQADLCSGLRVGCCGDNWSVKCSDAMHQAHTQRSLPVEAEAAGGWQCLWSGSQRVEQ